MDMKCDRAPSGWYCKLPFDHDGPCPAWPKWWKRLELRFWAMFEK